MGTRVDGVSPDIVSAAIGSSFLGVLPRSLRDGMQREAQLRRVAPGAIVTDDGDILSIGIVVSGLARVNVEQLDGHESTLRYVRPGGSVGVEILVGDRHPVDIRAVSSTLVVQLNAGRLKSVLHREPQVVQAIAQELASWLLDACDLLAWREGASVRQRLAGVLLEVTHDSAVENASGGGDLVVLCTHQALADAIGCAREVVSRALLAFAREDLVALGRGKIHVLDSVRLQVIARHPGQDLPNGVEVVPGPVSSRTVPGTVIAVTDNN